MKKFVNNTAALLEHLSLFEEKTLPAIFRESQSPIFASYTADDMHHIVRRHASDI